MGSCSCLNACMLSIGDKEQEHLVSFLHGDPS